MTLCSNARTEPNSSSTWQRSFNDKTSPITDDIETSGSILLLLFLLLLLLLSNPSNPDGNGFREEQVCYHKFREIILCHDLEPIIPASTAAAAAMASAELL